MANLDTESSATTGAFYCKSKRIGASQGCFAGTHIWVVANGQLRVLTQNARDVQTFTDCEYTCVASETKFVFAGTKAGQVIVYDSKTRTKVDTYKAHEGAVTKLYAGPEGVWSAGEDAHLRMWGLHGEIQTSPVRLDGPVTALASVGSDLWVASITHDGSHALTIFRPRSTEPPTLLPTGPDGNKTVVHSILAFGNSVWTGDEREIVVWEPTPNGGAEVMLRLANPTTGSPIGLQEVGGKIWSFDSKVRIWDPVSGQMLGELQGTYSRVNAVLVVGIFVWVLTVDEMMRAFLSQDRVLAAQKDLQKYGVANPKELEALFTDAMKENEKLCLLLRSLQHHMSKAQAWFTRNTIPEFVTRRVGIADRESHTEIRDIDPLVRKLHALEQRMEQRRRNIMSNWDVSVQIREAQAVIAENDPVKAELNELHELFSATCQSIVAEHQRCLDQLSHAKENLEKEEAALAEQDKKNKAEQTDEGKKVTAAKDDLDKKKKQETDCKAELDRLNKEIKDFQAQKEKLEKDMKALPAQKDKAQKDIEAEHNNKLKLQHDFSEVERKRKLAKTAELDQEQATANAQQAVQPLIDQDKALDAKVQQINASKEKANKDIASRKTEVDGLEKKVSELQSKIKTAQEEYKKCCLVV